MSSSNRGLPPKENALFKRLMRCYDQKQYKNGLKFCKQILKNAAFADHPETLAMKGLMLNAVGRREEAYDHVRRGLRTDLKSTTCWHVYGLLFRSERKYDDAIKCYRNALKWDRSNLQILREMSTVQIQIRDLRGYRDSRHQLFNLKPDQRASWIGLAISYHLLKDYEMTLKILENFHLLQKQNTKNVLCDYERSEVLLYEGNVLAESGDFSATVKHLLENGKNIYDKTWLIETTAKLYHVLGNFSEAVTAYEKLIKRNPDNIYYYKGLAMALQIENDTKQKLLLYAKYSKMFPRAFLPKRLPLDCSEDEEFLSYLRPYVTSALTKGVPPLFGDLQPLYKDAKKVAAIENLLEGIVGQLIENSRYFPLSENDESDDVPASALLWAYYYLAQHYHYLGNFELALKYIDKAIEHTPTLIELFMCKGKIYKHGGDAVAAAKWMEEARDLDTADRFTNSKSAKYHIRADDIEVATAICGKFTKEETNAMENLNDMQCMWFQTECALAYQRTGKWGEALKKCHEVDRHFQVIIDDQYDFHGYCLRKVTLSSYMELLQLENVIRAHPFYFKAAKCAIQVYIKLFDDENALLAQNSDDKRNLDNLPPSELKRMKNKERKAKMKAELEQAAAEKKQQHPKPKPSDDGENLSPLFEELIPEKLMSTSNQLSQAIKFLVPLQLFSSGNIETHLLAFEIYNRKNKILLMLQSIKRAWKIDPENPTLHIFLVKFYQAMESRWNGLQEPLPRFIKQEMDKIYAGKSAVELNALYLAAHSNSMPCLVAASQMLYFLMPEKQDKAIQLITTAPKNVQDATIETCGNIIDILTSGSFGNVDPKIISTFQEKCQRRFPYAARFRFSKCRSNGTHNDISRFPV